MKVMTQGLLLQVWLLAMIVFVHSTGSEGEKTPSSFSDSKQESSKIPHHPNRNTRHLQVRQSKKSVGTSPAAGEQGGDRNKSNKKNPPNVLVFLVDDLGWNQVGYHARAVGNTEVQTPHIDNYATQGIEMDRGYMTPWCGPSRAALQTGRTNSFNANISNDEWIHARFDDDIGFVGGLQPGTKTIATAFKEYGKKTGRPYKTYYAGKWGIGGSTWTNTPMGMGYDTFRGFWGDSLESCDGWHPWDAVPPYFVTPPDTEFGPSIRTTLPGYWEQSSPYPTRLGVRRFKPLVTCLARKRILPASRLPGHSPS